MAADETTAVVPGGETPSLVSKALGSFGNLVKYVTILDVTTDLCIPSYLAVWDGPIYNERGALFASCANVSAERAVVGALTELAQCLMWAGSLIDKQEHLPDPTVEKISRIEEHVLWPLRSTARPSFAFALSSENRVTLDERIDASSSDVLASIQKCVGLIEAQGLEVVAVDVTSPDVREIGLHVVRVIIPGAQPLFFGTGLHLLSNRSRRNLYSDRASDAINLHPHPFP